MIQLSIQPGEKYIELGGGANPRLHPNVDVRQCFDADGKPTVDFTANFEEPLPIGSGEFDGAFSQYALEHISWRKLPGFLQEVFRILKPGGRVCFVTPNTEAQLQWIRDNPDGWDEKGAFVSKSCVLFGDQDYSDNTHKSYLDPDIMHDLLTAAGFIDIDSIPYGERHTDMVTTATKPVATLPKVVVAAEPTPNVLGSHVGRKAPQTTEERAALFDRHYFNGGTKVGGYAREGYWDYPVHEITARHILARNPSSVVELGCGRGYILKRINDTGISGGGLEISRHCYLTRVTTGVRVADLCNPEVEIPAAGLCYSIATLEHIPEECLPTLIKKMAEYSRRGLHGIDFGGHDDGFDKTHCTLRPKEWWEALFTKYAPGWPVELLDKEELERGDFPPGYYEGDGRIKLNIGCGPFTLFHRGWTNIDILDIGHFAQHYRYNYLRHDVRQGLGMFKTETANLIFASHFLEHLSYAEGLAFLKECRRVLKPSGALRLIVPDIGALSSWLSYPDDDPNEYDELGDNIAGAKTKAQKFWELAHSGHQAAYDAETLSQQLTAAGFEPIPAAFRNSPSGQEALRKEVTEMEYGRISLFMEAVPRMR